MTITGRSRASKWFHTIVQALMAGALVMIGLVSFSTVASANAANPDPSTTGTITPNSDGTVTATLSGTWTWASQSTCSGRYGEGWAVDWWGISTSSTPNPNFSLSNATEVNPPGTTTTGTVSKTGTIGLPGSKFFHVGQYLNGEAVNATPGVCTVTSSGIKGAWSASATYPTYADVPAQLCVNMYDLHSVTQTSDFSPTGNTDNSIQKNAFDPTVGNGFCTTLKLVNVPTTTTTQVNHSTIALGPNGTLSDSATVTGIAAAGRPAGTVAFYVCGPTMSNALCASTTDPVGTATLPAATDPANGFVSTGTSGSFTPHQVGTYCFAAVYTPATGSPYTGSSDNQTSPNGTPDAAECAAVTTATSVTTTSASSASITLGPAPGGSVTDHVTVTGTPNAGLPTGTVNFYVCGPTAANAVCTSTAKPEGTATLPASTDPANGDVSTGTSNVSFTPTQVGTYCFAAVFTPAPGGNYSTSSGNQTTLENSECLTAGAATSTTTTTASSHSITIGPNGSVTDSVTVTGTPNAGPPMGTVAFYVCGPTTTNAPCTSTAKPEGTATEPAATDSSTGDTSTGMSSSFSPTTPGIYCFAAVFTPTSGSNYTGSADNNSTTLDPAECFDVGSAANVTVVKTSDPATGTTVVPGQHIGYTLTASNSGTEASGSVTIADPIPANTTFVPGSASCGTVPNCTPSFANNTVTFTITSIAGGATNLALTFGVTVNANATVTIDNVATVTGPPGCTTAPGCPTNHTDNPVAVFGVVKTSNPASGTTVVPGQTIAYTLTASNVGDGATGQEVVTDAIPANSTYVAGSASCGTVPHCTVAFANNTVTFTLTTVAPGATNLALTFSVTVNANATVTIDNVATITGPGCTTPTDCPTNHTDNPVASFHVVKTSNPASGTTVVPGQAITYTLTASNTGNAATGQEVVSDPIPANATYVAGSANCGTVPNCTAAYTANTNTVTFTLTSVAAGASNLALTFGVTVNANATVTIDNVATITGPGCTTGCSTNHTDNPVAAFRVVKSASPPSGSTVTPGQVITYTLTASNAGDAATGQEIVTDVVPANSTYVAGSASCGTVPHCTAAFANNTVTFTLTTVAAGATNQALTFGVTVNNNPTGTTIVNTATITGAQCSTGCPTNSTTHTVLNPAVLSVSKVGCATTAVPGETFTYTILYANTGGGDSTNTVLTDILPPVSQAIVTNAGGGTATTVGGHPALVWNLGTLVHNTSGSKTVQFLVTGSSGSITNVATIASSNAAVTAATSSTVTTPISTAGANTHGNAYAATVGLLGIPLINQLGLVSTVAPGAPQNAANQLVPTLGLPGLVLLNLISQTSHSSVSTSAQSTSSSQIAGVNLLNGAITADVIRAQSHSIASVGDNTHDSFGSNFVNLKVNGVPITTVAPNTAVNVTLGGVTVAQVILYQDTGTVNHVGSFNVVTDTVNMINVTLLAPFGVLPAGAQIIIGHAATDATFPSQNPACGGTQGAVSGEAFTAGVLATLLGSPVAGAVVGDAVLPITGGAAANGVNGTFIPGLAASGTATDTTVGSLAPSPHSSSDSRIEGLNLLGGLITADVVDASCTSAAGGGHAATLLATTFVNLHVGGIAITVAVAPNTTIAIPYNGGIVDLVLNQQVRAGNGISDTAGTVNALHLYVLNGSGLLTLEVVVASAHCDAHTGL